MIFRKFGRSVSLRLLSVAAASVLGLSAATAAQAESLADAIAMAYGQNPTLARARAQQRANDENYVQTRSRFGPALGLGGSVSYTDADTDPFLPGSQRSTTSLSVSADQTIFTSGGLTNSLRASEANVLSGQQDLRAVESQVLLDVIQVYTAVRRDQQALRISQDNYDILKQQLDQTRAQFEAGQLTRTDVAQSEARLAASAADLAQAQARLDANRAQYVAIVGQAPVALEAEPALPGLPADFNEALATAERNNPDLQAALYAEDAARALLASERSVFGPSVSLGASYGGTAPTNDLGLLGEQDSATATVRFSVPLFSAGLNGSRVRQAAEQYNAQRITTEIVRRNVVSQVSQAWSQMIAARSAVSSNEEQVRAAQVAAEGLRIEQQVGLRTNIEVLNAQQELKSAQLQLLEAQRTQYVAASQLLSVMGGLTAPAFDPGIEVYDPNANFDRVRRKGWTPLEPVARAVDGLVAGGDE